MYTETHESVYVWMDVGRQICAYALMDGFGKTYVILHMFVCISACM